MSTGIAGRYTLGREIGRGGMGAVWLGRDEVLGRSVAIKRVGMLPGGSSPDLERAEREARIAAQVNHPHVVAVFDLVSEDEAQWLIMEYVEGTTLAELVKANGSLPPDQAAPLLAQAAEALTAAHNAGIVHRDVKPSNLLVTADGQVKLTDFGIARAEADASLTQTGLVTGSPAYLAPEVASGKMATEASDVWSFGATLFHALAGRPPYDMGENVVGGLYKIVHEEPPRLTQAGWLTPMLEHTMERDPEQRWSMAHVLQHFETRGAGPEPTITMAAVAPAAESAPPPEPSLPAPSPSEPPPTMLAPTPADPGAARPHSKLLPAMVAVIALVGLLLLGLAIGLGTDDDPQEPSVGNDPSGTSSSTSPVGDRPTADGMSAFIETYLTTAANDPRAGYGMLSPGFQADSGGFSGYNTFWKQVSEIRFVASVEAEPETLEVTYTYTYGLKAGGERTETVSLQLEYADGTYLIADEA